ncbi:hypothetical protein QUA70_12985 [Microcoleus sp. LAD1_D5]|uniref:hypothetical protein n=1 Tax=unclassified Microcoleus TaxID=2642155 RepID=UPI002FD4B835
MDGVVKVIAGKIRSHFPIIHQKSTRVSEALEEDRTLLDKSISRMMRSPLLPSKTKKCIGKSLHRPRLSS